MQLRHDFAEMASAQLLAVTGGLIAGTMLVMVTNKLELIPGIFILLPGFLEMRGSISGTLSGRLSSGLFVGALKPEVKSSRILNANLIASMVLAVVVSLALGLVAYGATFLFNMPDPRIIFIALFAGILSNLIEIPLTVTTTFWLFRRGHDPNNVMGPYLTTTGDIVSMIALSIAIVIV